MKKLSVILLTVVMSVMMVVPAFADKYNGYEAPAVDSYPKFDEYPYVYLYIENGEIWLRGTQNPLITDGYWLKYTDDTTLLSYLYVYRDGTWKCMAMNNSIISLTNLEIVWSNYDIYDLNGDVYFYAERPPLAEVINGVVGNTLNNDTVPSVSSAMTILCVTGVGLLAMLVLLKLFGKRSLIHR